MIFTIDATFKITSYSNLPNFIEIFLYKNHVTRDFFNLFFDEQTATKIKKKMNQLIEDKTIPNNWGHFFSIENSSWQHVNWKLSSHWKMDGSLMQLVLEGEIDTDHWIKKNQPLNHIFETLDFEVNTHCNRACSYCPNSIEERKFNLMPLDLYLKIMKELATYNYSGNIHFNFFNEPLLDKRLPQFISLAKEYCPNAKREVFTNGDLLNYKTFRTLVDAGTTYFCVSLHDNVIPPAIEQWYSQASVEEKKLIFLKRMDQVFIDDRYLQGLSDDQIVATNKYLEHPCNRAAHGLVISAEGKVLACCLDFGDKFSAGDVKHQTLKEIWDSEKLQEFRSDLVQGMRDKYDLCRNCGNTAFTYETN